MSAGPKGLCAGVSVSDNVDFRRRRHKAGRQHWWVLRRAPHQLPTNFGAVLAKILLFDLPSGVAVVAAILFALWREKSVAESGCNRLMFLGGGCE